MKDNIYSLLRRKFPPEQYALMKEVSDKAGFDRSRSADYMLMGLWPSRGLALSGIELKSHRSDWLSELKNHKKAENIFQYCDHFWLLTNGEGIAKIEEIPATWGWMQIKGDKIYVIKEAPKLEPKEVSKSFMAALLKRASDKTGYVHTLEIQDQLTQEFNKGKDTVKYDVSRLEKQIADYKKMLETYKEASGIDLNIHTWSGEHKKIGAAVHFITNNHPDVVYKRLMDLADSAEKFSTDIKNNIHHLKPEENEC